MQSRFAKFSPTLLETREIYSLSKDMVIEFDKRFSEEPFFVFFTPSLKENLAAIDELTAKAIQTEFSVDDVQVDSLRGKLYDMILGLLENDMKLAALDPRNAQVAEAVYEVFKNYPVEMSGSYAEESRQLRRLFKGLDAIKETVVKCTAARRIESLRNEQEKFELWWKKQEETESCETPGELFPELDVLAFKLNSALNYLEIQAMIHGEQYETTASLMESLIMKAMSGDSCQVQMN